MISDWHKVGEFKLAVWNVTGIKGKKVETDMMESDRPKGKKEETDSVEPDSIKEGTCVAWDGNIHNNGNASGIKCRFEICNMYGRKVGTDR